MWLLQRVHSETKVSCDFVIYNKSQRVHRALNELESALIELQNSPIQLQSPLYVYN